MAKRRKWSGTAKRFVRRYNAYRKSFNARVDKMISQGLTPYDAIPLNYRQYKEIFTEERNDRLKEIEKGERTTLGNINAKIISDQVYELSEEQAYAIFDYMKTFTPEEKESLNFSYKNINTAIARIRQGEFVKKDLGLWNIISAERDKLFSANKEEKEALIEKWSKKLKRTVTHKDAVRHEISQTFFGSP